jgi:hypothetical protein
MEIESQLTLGLVVLMVPMDHPVIEPQHILPAVKRQCSSNLILYLPEADLFAEDRKAVFRLRSFVVTYRRLHTQVHILFKLSSLTLLMRTRTASMNPASTFSYTIFASEMLEACLLLRLDPYISSFRELNSWSPSPQSLLSFHDRFNRVRK